MSTSSTTQERNMQVPAAISGTTAHTALPASSLPASSSPLSISALTPSLVLYASQTGNSENIAGEMYALWSSNFTGCSIHSMSQYLNVYGVVDGLSKMKVIVIVISSTGQGDPPDNAVKFLRALRKKTDESKQWLSGVKYAVLGLGDTNYDEFGAAPIRVDKEMTRAGATKLLDREIADDAVGLGITVEPYKHKLITALNNIGREEISAQAQMIITGETQNTSQESHNHASTSHSVRQYTPSATATAIRAAQAAMQQMGLKHAGCAHIHENISATTTTMDDKTTSSSDKESSPVVVASTPSALVGPSPTTVSPVSSSPLSISALTPSLVLYASQTGNSESIAREMYALWSSSFTGGSIHSMSQYLNVYGVVDGLSKMKVIVIVISSTGQGDPPDNAMKFLRAFRKKTDESKQWLSGVKYAVLGLGDTNYDEFGAAPIRVDKEMTRAGATKLLDREIADDAVGLGITVEPYKHKLLTVLKQLAAAETAAQKPAATDQSTMLPSVQASLSFFISQSKDRPVEEETKEKAAAAAPFSSPVVVSTSSSSSSFSDEHKTADDHDAPSQLVTHDPVLPATKVKVNKPIGLARFHSPRIAVQVSPGDAASSSSSLSTYFAARWRCIDTEAVLKGYTPDAPFFVSVASARYLTTPKSHQQGRRVVHMELQMSSSPIDTVMYSPGDSIGCYCVNDMVVVQQLAERLGWNLTDQVEIKVREDEQSGQEDAGVTTVITHTHHSTTTAAGKYMSTAAPSPATRAASSSPLPIPPMPSSNGSALPHISSPCTIADILVYCVDLTSAPKKTFLRMLAEHCTEKTDKEALYHLASHTGKKDYDALIVSHQYSLLQLLQRYASCQPSIEYLLDHLPALQPRYYSISSSPLVHPIALHIAYTIVDQGVCTSWLTQVCQQAGYLLHDDDEYRARDKQPLLGVKVEQHTDTSSSPPRWFLPVFMRRTHTFTLPPSLSTPLIFIGPGTGVAPFRSFLFHRRCQLTAMKSGGTAMGWWRGLAVDMIEEEEEETPPAAQTALGFIDRFQTHKQTRKKQQHTEQQQAHTETQHTTTMQSSAFLPSSSPSTTTAESIGTVLLFFGCRAPDQDYLYESDFSAFVADHILNELITAYSRVSDKKVYVQDRMKEQGEKLWKLLQHGAMLFVCGDGAGMAKGVMSAVQAIFMEYGHMTAHQAMQAVASLMKEKRYVQDIWS